MRTLPLTRGLVAIVDDDDFDLLSQYKWFAIKSNGRLEYPKTWYACRKAQGKQLMMHHALLGVRSRTDHINGNGLDNRRENLRHATASLNAFNAGKRLLRNGDRPTSFYKGVTWYKVKNCWLAQITIGGKLFRLGYFTDEADAAQAYDCAAIQIVGEFARLNFDRSLYIA